MVAENGEKTQNTDTNTSAPDYLTPWKPGQSGNPGGRPKMPPELKEMLKKVAPELFQVAIDIAKDKKSKNTDRLRATELLLDRVYGKSPQPIVGDEESAAIVVKLAGDLENWGK
jgi:hypothetical protein